MSIQITVPSLGESVSEATVLKWFKNVGDAITVDEPLVELETDKVTVEVPAPSAGVLTEILVGDGIEVAVGTVLGSLEAGAVAAAVPAAPAAEPAPAPAVAAEPAVAAPEVKLSPAVRKLVDEKGLNPTDIPATGKKGQLTKGDVEAFLAAPPASASAPTPALAAAAPRPIPPPRHLAPCRPGPRTRARRSSGCRAFASASPSVSRRLRTRLPC